MTYEPATDSRKRAVRAFKERANFHQVELQPHFQSYGAGYTASSVADREIPSNQEIIQTYYSIINFVIDCDW